MKIKPIIVAIAMLIVGAGQSSAFDLKSLLNAAKDTTNSSSSSSIESIIGGIANSLFSSDKIDINTLVGDWKYKAPAVKLRSDNILKSAGGAAATGVIENKLKPYYKKAGIEKMTLSFAADSTFSMTISGITLSGKVTTVTDKNSDANFVLQFMAFKMVNIGSYNTYVTKNADSSLDITFDISKLISMLQTIAKYTKNQTLSTASTLLSSYDGVCAGFKVVKTK